MPKEYIVDQELADYLGPVVLAVLIDEGFIRGDVPLAVTREAWGRLGKGRWGRDHLPPRILGQGLVSWRPDGAYHWEGRRAELRR